MFYHFRTKFYLCNCLAQPHSVNEGFVSSPKALSWLWHMIAACNKILIKSCMCLRNMHNVQRNDVDFIQVQWVHSRSARRPDMSGSHSRSTSDPRRCSQFLPSVEKNVTLYQRDSTTDPELTINLKLPYMQTFLSGQFFPPNRPWQTQHKLVVLTP